MRQSGNWELNPTLVYLEGKNVAKDYIRVLISNAVCLVGFGTCLRPIGPVFLLSPTHNGKVDSVLSHHLTSGVDNLFAFTGSEPECSLPLNESHLAGLSRL